MKKKKFILIVCIIAISLISVLAYVGFRAYQRANRSTSEIVQTYLREKLSEDFDDEVVFETSVANPDADIGMDGSVFFTIKGKGTKEVYSVYSAKEDIYFLVVVDTGDKTIMDTYQQKKVTRDTITDFYQDIEQRLSGHATATFLSENTDVDYHQVEGAGEILASLSRLRDEDAKSIAETGSFTSISLNITIDQETLRYCKDNTDLLNEINSLVAEVNESVENSVLNFTVTGSDDIFVCFDGVDGKV